jgi:hypothetical protein
MPPGATKYRADEAAPVIWNTVVKLEGTVTFLRIQVEGALCIYTLSVQTYSFFVHEFRYRSIN